MNQYCIKCGTQLSWGKWILTDEYNIKTGKRLKVRYTTCPNETPDRWYHVFSFNPRPHGACEKFNYIALKTGGKRIGYKAKEQQRWAKKNK